jgi:hypothetical protein
MDDDFGALDATDDQETVQPVPGGGGVKSFADGKIDVYLGPVELGAADNFDRVAGATIRAMGSEPDSRFVWSRAGQDALDAELLSREPVEPRPIPFLERPVGNVTVRWVVVLVAFFFGGIVGLAVGGAIWSDEPFSQFFVVPLAFASAVVAGLVTGLACCLRNR